MLSKHSTFVAHVFLKDITLFFFFNVAAIFSFTTKVVCVAVEKCQFKNSTRGKYADTHTRLVCFAII